MPGSQLVLRTRKDSIQQVDSPAFLCCIRGHCKLGSGNDLNDIIRLREPVFIDKNLIGLKTPRFQNAGMVNEASIKTIYLEYLSQVERSASL